MRWRETGVKMLPRPILLVTLLFIICATHSCDGSRRITRRKDSSRSLEALHAPTPSAESLHALAQATGAAGFEAYTEGKALVKRLIPEDSRDQDLIEHQGVIGKAGVDFPAYPSIPNTGFNCRNVPTGYYADLETDCQVFHICDTSRKISFLCPNGTIFSQSHLICDWWFKVDCASAPALYESSAEYYSNEQKKSRRIAQSLSKNQNVQIVQPFSGDSNERAESRPTSVNVPSTTERLLRLKQKIQNDLASSSGNVRGTVRSHQNLFGDINTKTTQNSQITSAFDKRRRNLVQLIANKYNNPAKTTAVTFSDASTYKTAIPAGDYNSIKETQIAAESASFANNNNRQFLQEFNMKTFRQYPAYTSEITPRPSKTKSNPTLTTLYDIRDKQFNNFTSELATTTKRPTLQSYTKSTFAEKQELYTRPGVSALKDFLEREKNKTLATTTEKLIQITPEPNQVNNNKVIIETKDSFESATKIPQTTRSDTFDFTQTASSDRYDVYSTNNQAQATTESSYKERRERLMRKLNLDTVDPTEATSTEKFYGDQPNRPGLIVPPSLSPKSLHTLAIYYATALDNLSTMPPAEETEATTPVAVEHETMQDELPALFSQNTINKYSNLFGQQVDTTELLEEIKLDPNGTMNEIMEDLVVQQSQNPFASSPQIRELAQVFTHALSAYLQDPVKFRKVLSDIRPTHPTFGDIVSTTNEPANTEPTTTVNEDDGEILGFSDDQKSRPILASLRDAKTLTIPTEYTTITEQPTTTQRPITTEITTTYAPITAFRSIFRCCGRISASYTSASTPKETETSQPIYTSTAAENVNNFDSNYSEQAPSSTTDSSLSVSRFAGTQSNSDENVPIYGDGVSPTDGKPLSEYVEATNLPSSWGIDITSGLDSTAVTNAHQHIDVFESKKIRKTTPSVPATTPVYFTERESAELENEEELQRAHSQSFVSPQSNDLRQGKQLKFDKTVGNSKTAIKKPAENLEAPTLSDIDITTFRPTTQPTTIFRIEETEASTTESPVYNKIFTSPDSDRNTNTFQWPTTYDNSWQSTGILDPITLNEGLSTTGEDNSVSQFTSSAATFGTNTATTPSNTYITTNEPTIASTLNVDVTTPGHFDRLGRLLKEPSSTESGRDLTTMAEAVVEKAKEMIGGMNSTTAEKLMNVMKKTKSKSVKRLILLLIQTCDDDHNTTAEASKKALLEALMAVSQKDMEEVAKEEREAEEATTTSNYEIVSLTDRRRGDGALEKQALPTKYSERGGKSIDFNAANVNSLSGPTTAAYVRTTTESVTEPTATVSLSTTPARRGMKKFLVRASPVVKTTQAPSVENPIAEASAVSQDNSKGDADTRALELLRSLYSIAARWG